MPGLLQAGAFSFQWLLTPDAASAAPGGGGRFSPAPPPQGPKGCYCPSPARAGGPARDGREARGPPGAGAGFLMAGALLLSPPLLVAGIKLGSEAETATFDRALSRSELFRLA